MNPPDPSYLSALLAPGEPRTSEQWDNAWEALIHSDSTPEARANAKCWLSYRALDGEVTVPDWCEKVDPVGTDAGFRWVVSQLAVDAYLSVLKLKDTQRFLRCAATLTGMTDMSQWRDNPGSLLSFIRVKAMEAYWFLLNPSPANDAAASVNCAFAVWQNTMGSFAWNKHPARWFEMHADVSVLTALSHIGNEAGLVERGLPPQGWCDTAVVEKKAESQYWFRCLKAIRKQSGGLW